MRFEVLFEVAGLGFEVECRIGDRFLWLTLGCMDRLAGFVSFESFFQIFAEADIRFIGVFD